MSVRLVTWPLFNAIKKAIGATPLQKSITGGCWNTDESVPEEIRKGQIEGNIPYAVFRSVSEAPQTFTNKSQYDTADFEVMLVVSNQDETRAAQMLADMEKVIKSIMPNGDQTQITNGMYVNKLRPHGRVRYEQTLLYWNITQPWECLIAKVK